MEKRCFLLIMIVMISSLISCSNFLEEEAESFLAAETEKIDAVMLEAELQGAYKAMLLYKNGRQIMMGISGTDEAQGATVEVNYWADQGAIDKYNVSLNSDNWLTAWMWNSSYFSISRANLTINSVKNVIDVTEDWKSSKEAEARFIRAMSYFMLAQYFGEVPLITEDIEPSSTPNYPREELAVIYSYILEDLKFAESNLKTAYRDGRATVGAAKALMMKVYMYAQPESGIRDYTKAKKEFEEIEQLKVYTLQPSYAELFMPDYENGTESVYEFQFDYPDEPNTVQYNLGSRAVGEYGPGSGYELLLPTKRYLELFEEGDERFDASVRTEFYKDGELITSAPDPEYIAPHCKKYEDDRNSYSLNSAKNMYYIRYADLILLYAECLNAEGDLAGAKAQVQRIRNRANAISPILASNEQEMLDFIFEERMRELGMEGWRRFDLIRRGSDYFVEQVGKYNDFAKGNVQTFHTLYPIPSNEISMNYGISEEDQNPGYK
ncbi:RagB/SusD family nutrient uptake outer membrane protein [Parabacteroides sp.]|uniref:RagB/SusD family nutrient uptake outer membrane protein n=1 Tax=Parabacteroides sp. TaxID=1869337 RepID=UPI00257C7CBF|nr:RagB/SusD family nutrient uptake outer membrane protein [Parabacteroides sp.]